MMSKELNPVNLTPRASLPSAAQRWLDRSIPEDFDFPASIRIEQEGTMEIRDRWTPFTASAVYKASPLSFNWRGRLSMLPGVWIIAEDGHLDGQAWGGAQLWGLIPMGKRTDPEVLVSQLVRNLGELPWLPSFVLADSRLTWTGLDETSFEVRSRAAEREVLVRFEINDQGDLVRSSSPARPYDVPDGFAEAPWHYEFSDHQDFGGVRIPATAVATFEKEDGPWEYFRGSVTSIEFGATQS